MPDRISVPFTIEPTVGDDRAGRSLTAFRDVPGQRGDLLRRGIAGRDSAQAQNAASLPGAPVPV